MKKVVCLAMLIPFISNGQVPLNGLVAGWPFSGNANDMSGNNNHGTVNNATLTTDRFGSPNSAYYFNGADANIVTLMPGPLGSSPRSVSFWALTESTSLMCAWGWGDESGGGSWGLEFNYCTPGLGMDNGVAAFMQYEPSVSDNQWHHYVVVFDSVSGTALGDARFFVDGSLLTTTTCAISNPLVTVNTNSINPFTIGSVPDNPIRFWYGKLDDFYMYDRALSALEVSQLYNTEGQVTRISEPFGQSLDVYPIPAKDQITIKGATTDLGYVLRDLTGRLVQKGQTNNTQIGIADIPGGIYLLTLFAGEKERHSRVIVE